MCILKNTQARFASVVLNQVMGPPRPAMHLADIFLILVLAATYKARSRDFKSHSKFETETRELLGREERKKKYRS